MLLFVFRCGWSMTLVRADPRVGGGHRLATWPPSWRTWWITPQLVGPCVRSAPHPWVVRRVRNPRSRPAPLPGAWRGVELMAYLLLYGNGWTQRWRIEDGKQRQVQE